MAVADQIKKFVDRVLSGNEVDDVVIIGPVVRKPVTAEALWPSDKTRRIHAAVMAEVAGRRV